MAKKSAKGPKPAKKRKPNVYMQSYEVTETGGVVLSKRPATSRRQKLQRRHQLRSEIYVSTLSSELKRMGVISAAVGGALVILTIVLNLV